MANSSYADRHAPDLTTKPCPKCGNPAEECIWVEENVRQGWYCPQCGEFDKAIGRERVCSP